jgi:hypothetical protein
MIILRFVHHPGVGSDLIDYQSFGNYSHVEALTPEREYIGAHANVGVASLPMDYDAGKFDRQRFLLLPADDAMSAKFYHYLRAVIGEPYDFAAIASFVVHLDFHQKHRVICSALQTLALRGCDCFPVPLPVPAHEISPRDLELGLMMRPDVRDVATTDPDFQAHILVSGENG